LPDVKPPAATFIASLVFRPGGFHNSNMTAALALLFLLLPRLHHSPGFGTRGLLVMVLAVAVIGLTQSRAGLAALLLYSAWLFRRHPIRLLVGVALALLVSVVSGSWDQGAVLFELVQRFGDRFGGDSSSTERAWLMRMALQSIQEAPLFGYGYGFLVDRYAAGGSHNQVIELLVAFGVVGGVTMLAAAVLLLWPASALLVLVGVLPSLLFSHNFFDSASFQAALGMALAIDCLAAAQPALALGGPLQQAHHAA
jgi:O-antigen ligase